MANLFISSQYCPAEKVNKQEVSRTSTTAAASAAAADHCSFSSNSISVSDSMSSSININYNSNGYDHELFSRPGRQRSFSSAGGAGSFRSSFCPSNLSPSSEERTLAALRTHSEAERRRRERINAHLCTLRRLIPNSAKMDKASLLGRVVEEMKDLKRKASNMSKAVSTINFPRETNEVNVELYDHNPGSSSRSTDRSLFIKVSICCEDRPELYAKLMEAFAMLRLQAERAEMMSLGGRVMNVFMLSPSTTESDDDYDQLWLRSLKDSIQDVLGRVAFSDVSANLMSKRRRALQSFVPFQWSKA